MNKLLWIVVAALAMLIIIGCVLSVPQNASPVHNNSGPVFWENTTVQKSLHEMSGEEIAAEFIRHNTNLSGYSATVHTIGGTGYEDEEYLFFTERPDRFRAEYIRSEIHGNGTIVVANRTFVWQYHPGTRTAKPDLIDDPRNTFFAWRDYPAIAARILENFPAVRNGTENRNGSTAIILEATVDGIPTQYYPSPFSRTRIWIDEDTLMMTRMELIGDYNETELAVDLTDFRVDPRLPDAMFDFVPPDGTEVSPAIADLLAPLNTSSMRPAKERFGRDLLLPAYLPEGYSFRYCLHYRDRDGRDSLVYSNGSGDLVFTQALKKDNASFAAPAGPETAIPVCNRTGTSWTESGTHHLRWNCGNSTCELAGTIANAEIARIAGSVEAPELINFAPDAIADPELIAAIALHDPSAQKMADSGGEIIGVGMSIKRGAKNSPGGIFPALVIRYNGLIVDVMVDPDAQKPVGRTIQVPNGAVVRDTGNQTVIEYDEKILFIFDPMEGTG